MHMHLYKQQRVRLWSVKSEVQISVRSNRHSVANGLPPLRHYSEYNEGIDLNYIILYDYAAC